MKRVLRTALVAASIAFGGQATAAVIASNTFDASSEGWQTGDFGVASGSLLPTFNPGGSISTSDTFNNVAFNAPSSYLGNQSAAFGGTVTFDLFDTVDDGIPYSPLALRGNGLTLYAQRVPLPSTIALSGFGVTLLGANFTTDLPFTAGGTVATDAQLQLVLASLDQFSILADWHGGADLTTLDNVIFSTGGPVGGVPEPASWALMIAGFGAVGAAARRRGKVTVTSA